MKQLLIWLFLQASISSYRTLRVFDYDFERGQGSLYDRYDETVLTLVNSKGTIHSDSFAEVADALEELEIRESNITQIEDGAFCSHPFETITIHSSRLPTLAKQMLKNCSSLKRFTFSQNNSTGDANFSPDMFSGLPNLKNLHIYDAWEFFHMSKRFVENSTSLEVFQVAGSNLKRIEAGAFDNLMHLKVLELSNTKLKSVDGIWSTLKSLVLIRVVKSSLKSFPWNELRLLSNVRYVELDRNEIESFDGNAVVENVPGLVNLTFWGNLVPCEKLQQEIGIILKNLDQVNVCAETC